MYKKLLVVDDLEINRILLSTFLERLKVPHDLAENGLHAIHLLEGRKYD